MRVLTQFEESLLSKQQCMLFNQAFLAELVKSNFSQFDYHFNKVAQPEFRSHSRN